MDALRRQKIQVNRLTAMLASGLYHIQLQVGKFGVQWRVARLDAGVALCYWPMELARRVVVHSLDQRVNLRGQRWHAVGDVTIRFGQIVGRKNSQVGREGEARAEVANPNIRIVWIGYETGLASACMPCKN